MVNVVLFPGNIKFNHSVGVANVIYCNGRVRVAGIMVKIVLNIPQSLRELRTVGLVIIKGYFQTPAQLTMFGVFDTTESTAQ